MDNLDLTDVIEVDELLCYISNKINLVPADNLITLCVGSFTEQQIENSKSKFYCMCKHGPEDIVISETTRFIRRKGENKSVNNIKDIIALFLEQKTNIPRFVAADLNNLPPLTMNSIDLITVLKCIETLKSDMANLKACVLAQQAAMKEVQSYAVQNQTANMSNMFRSISTMATRTPNDSVYVPDKTYAQALVAQPVTNKQRQVMQSRDSTNNRNRSKQRANVEISSADDNENQREEGFQPVHYRRRKNTRTFITGKSKKDSGLAGIARKPVANVFVTRLPPNCTEVAIHDFLLTNLQLDCTVEKITNTKHEESFSSFHVQCNDCADPEVMLNPDIWPENCLFRKWYPAKKRQNGE